MIVAIDGPAASGKSSIARRIAFHYHLPHLNTGALYRAVARDLLIAGAALDDAGAAASAARHLDPLTLGDEALRERSLGEAASLIAVHQPVRDALKLLQQDFIQRARQERGAVVEGRDIGTVICPDADKKLFIVASVEERAKRRRLELTSRGEAVTDEAILADLLKRDDRDASRANAPMLKAQDAYLLDTTKLDIEAALQAAVDFIGPAHRP